MRRRRTTTSDEEDEEDEVEDDDESRGVSAEFLSMEESLATLETIKMNLAGQVPAEGDAAAPEVVDVHLSDDARSEQGGGASSGLRDNAGGGELARGGSVGRQKETLVVSGNVSGSRVVVRAFVHPS